MNVNDCIEITDKDERGYGRVSLPSIDGCQSCGGRRWIRRHGERIEDPILATKLAYVIAGYTMRKEEQETGRKHFVSYGTNSHEGFEPDYWQSIPDYYPCCCSPVVAELAEFPRLVEVQGI